MKNKTFGSYQNERVNDLNQCSPVQGKVVCSPAKLIWLGSMYVVAIVGGILTFSIESLVVFVISTAVTLCLGHSLGMHRRLIHQSYQCPKWLEYFLVHLGVLVGLAGPKGMLETHDMRDWAQRQPCCHDYYSHQQPMLIDAYWQLFCELKLQRAPTFKIEERIETDRLYHWMEILWMWQQLPWAILLFTIGGLPWVVWGICMRVAVSVTGHWFIGYFAHNQGDRNWHVSGAGVQGFNIKFASLITMGESWHNNHHAFPGSALLGIEKGQMDPGWWVLLCLQKIGLVWDMKLPQDLPPRRELVEIKNETNSLLEEKSS